MIYDAPQNPFLPIALFFGGKIAKKKKCTNVNRILPPYDLLHAHLSFSLFLSLPPYQDTESRKRQMRDIESEVDQLVEDETETRAAIYDEWIDTWWVDNLPVPHFQKKYRILLKELKAEYKARQLAKEADTIHAFSALGGSSNQTGEVKSELLRRNVKDFGLTIDIDRLISEADTDGSGLIDYGEFKEMFASTQDEKQVLSGTDLGTPQPTTFQADFQDPSLLPDYLSFGSLDTRHRRRSSRRRTNAPRYRRSQRLLSPDQIPPSHMMSALLPEAEPTSVTRPKSLLLASSNGIFADTDQHVPQWCYEEVREARKVLPNKRFPKPTFTNIANVLATNLSSRQTTVQAAKHAQAAFVTQLQDKRKRPKAKAAALLCSQRQEEIAFLPLSKYQESLQDAPKMIAANRTVRIAEQDATRKRPASSVAKLPSCYSTPSWAVGFQKAIHRPKTCYAPGPVVLKRSLTAEATRQAIRLCSGPHIHMGMPSLCS